MRRRRSHVGSWLGPIVRQERPFAGLTTQVRVVRSHSPYTQEESTAPVSVHIGGRLRKPYAIRPGLRSSRYHRTFDLMPVAGTPLYRVNNIATHWHKRQSLRPMDDNSIDSLTEGHWACVITLRCSGTKYPRVVVSIALRTFEKVADPKAKSDYGLVTKMSELPLALETHILLSVDRHLSIAG
jgi:hypothetical protein